MIERIEEDIVSLDLVKFFGTCCQTENSWVVKKSPP
jgi:hypothetical protein